MYNNLPEGYKTSNPDEIKEIAKFDYLQNHTSGITWLLYNIRWFMFIYIFCIHILALYSIPLLFKCHIYTAIATISLGMIGNIGITAGPHRLYSHKSYKASLMYRWFIMLCTSIANEGTIIHWVRDHRTHHKYSETRADPHNALRGFFFAHVGWLLFKKDPRVKFAGKHIPMNDITNLSEVQFHQRFNPFLNLFCCFIFPALVGHYGWGETFYNAFMLMGVLKYVYTLHCTWLVNSYAHLYGNRPYNQKINPAESPFVSLFAVGEGWHNYHHTFPSDYAASEFGTLYQFNPTKIFIDTCALLSLIWDRNRSLHLCERRLENKKKIITGWPLFKSRTI